MKAKGHIPERTCISCRTKHRKNDLIKLLKDSKNHLIRNDSGRLMGRGAYVCDTPACLERLLNNTHLKRYFRTDRAIYVSHEFSGMLRSSDKNRQSGRHQ